MGEIIIILNNLNYLINAGLQQGLLICVKGYLFVEYLFCG